MADDQPLIIGNQNDETRGTALSLPVVGFSDAVAFFVSTDGGRAAIFGRATTTVNPRTVGVHGDCSVGGAGVLGTTEGGLDAPSDTLAAGVVGASAHDLGVYGLSTARNGTGVRGDFRGSSGLNVTAANCGVAGTSDAGVGVQGFASTGHAGVRGDSANGTGVIGDSANGTGVIGQSVTGTGILGTSDSGTAIRADSDTGTAISGFSGRSDGVRGGSGTGTGVLGTTEGSTAILGIQGNSRDPRGEGVFGVAGTSDAGVGVQGFSTGHTGVRGDCSTGTGVIGDSANGTGVIGQSVTGTGILGTSDSGTAISGFSGRSDGLRGESNSGIGIHGVSQGGIAARFDGNVVVNGDFSVTGVKSALVPCPDGSHRRFYSLESPESWFEDFGTGQVVEGRGLVRFDPEFAALTRGDKYHVFLTPRGDCRGLYVNAETSDGFEVHELQGGTSTVSFDYRVVARRKDVAGPRLECVTIPACT